VSAKLIYTEEEILADHPYVEPLISNDVRCHGGFLDNGKYQSPRTLHRWPAISAWQEQVQKDFGTELVRIPEEIIPPHFPNVDQIKYLMGEGHTGMFSRILTMIGFVEGMGANLRMLPVPNWSELIVEPIDGTALDHLKKGLFEAHARDEAGHKEQAGHNIMWEIVRDLAIENPEIPTNLAFSPRNTKNPMDFYKAHPKLPFGLAMFLDFMCTLLSIEIFAARAFTWAEEVARDDSVCRNATEAANMVDYIRVDEAPHVGYLKAFLSELKARTIIGEGGVKIPGEDIIQKTIDDVIRRQTGEGLREGRIMRVKVLKEALDGNPKQEELLEGFFARGPEADRVYLEEVNKAS